ncbi:hypothetical protein GCM10009767_16140 [Kocuria aegyptia]|uniref:Uncharacterized protein n=1 Tax=Kocuria aegyptia TaxID=330943 RepID=A0ABN2KJ23_9MICC
MAATVGHDDHPGVDGGQMQAALEHCAAGGDLYVLVNHCSGTGLRLRGGRQPLMAPVGIGFASGIRHCPTTLPAPAPGCRLTARSRAMPARLDDGADEVNHALW